MALVDGSFWTQPIINPNYNDEYLGDLTFENRRLNQVIGESKAKSGGNTNYRTVCRKASLSQVSVFNHFSGS
ncbi:hypothetical protein P8452_06755 [Trifolium repens]|nr:hypothetical protein P8452_06755 [Trifolium repens]